MTTSNTLQNPQSVSSPSLTNIHITDCRPNFEAALARIIERKADTNLAKRVSNTTFDSFGTWYEAD